MIHSKNTDNNKYSDDISNIIQVFDKFKNYAENNGTRFIFNMIICPKDVFLVIF